MRCLTRQSARSSRSDMYRDIDKAFDDRNTQTVEVGPRLEPAGVEDRTRPDMVGGERVVGTVADHDDVGGAVAQRRQVPHHELRLLAPGLLGPQAVDPLEGQAEAELAYGDG